MTTSTTSITLTLAAHHEQLAAVASYPPAYQQAHAPPLLAHQVATYHALATTPLVLNTFPTGTGKTQAALLRLLDPAMQGENTLLIAPTNALIDQHVRDVQAFVAAHGLPFTVVPITADLTATLVDDVTKRRGSVLVNLIANPRQFAAQLGLAPAAARQGLVLVTNPDIFHLALFLQYGKHDRLNLFGTFLTQFAYTIIDEFHYYDNKQFITFLFYMVLLHELGWLTAGQRRLCLLSATPRPQVSTLLTRLFGAHGWHAVAPTTLSPPPNASTTPSLAPLHLTLVATDATHQLDSWVATNAATVAQWLADDRDTVMISSSLARINTIYQTLQAHDPVRITGPEDQAERQRVAPLTLATPTVDIGYNFGRAGKHRQSVDRLVCDARYSDEVVQRIGRAGRVLGRTDTTTPSAAIVLLPADAVTALAAHKGATLSRAAWQSALDGIAAALPPKHTLDGYIQTFALEEVFHPIFGQWREAEHSHVDQEIAAIFAPVRDLFAPQSTQTIAHLKAKVLTYQSRKRWLRAPAPEQWSTTYAKRLAADLAAFANQRAYQPGQAPHYEATMFEADIASVVARLDAATRASLVQYVQGCVALTDTLLAFRDGWQGIATAVYDPKHLLSSRRINQYDLLHLLENYRLTYLPDAAAFKTATHTAPPPGSQMYVQLDELLPRNARRRVALRWHAPDHLYDPSTGTAHTTTFNVQYCGVVVPLVGIALTLHDRGAGGNAHPLPPHVAHALAQQPLAALLVPKGTHPEVALLRDQRAGGFPLRDLTVVLGTHAADNYRLVPGTAAFHVYAALYPAFARYRRSLAAHEPIFC